MTGESLTVEALTVADEADYEQFVSGLPHGLLYYGLSYRNFLADLLDAQPSYWVARRGGEIEGVLPLLSREGPWGRVCNSLAYYGSHGGVLARTEAAREALVSQYDTLTAAGDVAASTWVNHPYAGPADPGVRHDMTDERISQITSLEGGPEDLLQRYDSSARRNIKKAATAGMTVAIENDQIDFLERTHRENMAEIGGAAKSPSFFQTFPRHFESGHGYRIYVARRAGEPVAALLLFYFARTVEYFTPVTRGDARPDQPMAAILHRAMADAQAEGYADWNWGGTWQTQDGVWRFKKKWGAQDRTYQYFITIGERALLEQTPQALSASYPGFFVAPFRLLAAA